MRLGWKIFLASFALITAAVTAVSGVLLRRDFSKRLEILQDSAAAEHTYVSSSLQNSLVQKRTDEKVPVLDSVAVSYAAQDAVDAPLSASGTGYCGAAVFTAGQGTDMIAVARTGEGEESCLPLLPEADRMTEGKCYSAICKDEDGRRIAVCSAVTAKEGKMYLYTVYDIDEAYSDFRARLITAAAVGTAASLAVSLVISLLIYAILRPVADMNKTLRLIADGDFSKRMTVRGGMEEREMAESVNALAQSVQDNVERLESIAEGRKHYVDSLAHEMKTPLTSILCFGDLLRIKRSVSDGERIEYAGIIVDEARRMKNLSSKLLELACADNMELEMEPVSVRELLTESTATIGPALRARGITLEYAGDDGVILCDRELFKSLIYNLCDNAAKASEAGQSVRLRSKAADNGMIISVSDSGIGMTKEVLKKVTEPFYMADKSRSRKAGGAGLGLSLCVEIAKRHNARITAKSRPGVGTTVYVTVPWAKIGGAVGDEK